MLKKASDYYPFGLTMTGISSKAAGKLENRYKFNEGTELNSDFDINLYETDYRSLDPQLGRFWQVDELAEYDLDWSPYSYAYNNPISFNDPLGLSPVDSVGRPAPAPNPVTDPNAPRGSEANPIPTGIDVVVTATAPAKNPLTNIPTQSATPQPIVIPEKGKPSQEGNTNNTGLIIAGSLAVRANPVGITITVGVGLGYTLYVLSQYSYNNDQSPAIPYNWMARDNTNHVPPFIVQSKDKDDHLKGGKQNKRDADIKRYPPDFQRWYHREYKPKVHPGRNATPEELKEAYDDWVEQGKPKKEK